MRGEDEVFSMIVEDEPALARSIRRYVRANWRRRSLIASCLAEARSHLEQGVRPRAFFIDVGLPDGSGMTFAEEIRTRFPHAAILIETAHCTREVAMRAHRIGAGYIVKPYTLADVAAFVDRAPCTADLDRRLHAANAALVLEHHLSPQERRLLDLKLRHYSNAEVAEEWGVKTSTVKSAARSLLSKTDVSTVTLLARRVWRIASEEAEPSRAEPSRAEPSRAEPSK